MVLANWLQRVKTYYIRFIYHLKWDTHSPLIVQPLIYYYLGIIRPIIFIYVIISSTNCRAFLFVKKGWIVWIKMHLQFLILTLHDMLRLLCICIIFIWKLVLWCLRVPLQILIILLKYNFYFIEAVHISFIGKEFNFVFLQFKFCLNFVLAINILFLIVYVYYKIYILFITSWMGLFGSED